MHVIIRIKPHLVHKEILGIANFIAINKPQFRNCYLSAYHFNYLVHKKQSEKTKEKT